MGGLTYEPVAPNMLAVIDAVAPSPAHHNCIAIPRRAGAGASWCRHPLRCAQGTTCRESADRCSDQRVRPNRVTLVTLTIRCPVLIYLTTTKRSQERTASRS